MCDNHCLNVSLQRRRTKDNASANNFCHSQAFLMQPNAWRLAAFRGLEYKKGTYPTGCAPSLMPFLNLEAASCESPAGTDRVMFDS